MRIYPAIDLLSGKAVRLLRGDYEKVTVYSENPLELAQRFKTLGAQNLHLVDLDGAKSGSLVNFSLIAEIVRKSSLSVQVGGGIRDMQAVDRYLSAGVDRVILGTAAVTDPEFLKLALSKYGEKIAVGVDIKDGFVATHGWTKTSGEAYYDFCTRLQDLGLKTLICTDISKDGAMQGTNVELYRELSQRFSMDIIASGGVTEMEDLRLLSETKVSGAILGKSLYTGSISLKEAVDTYERS
ncbi:MAG: 1-(5-phosphoribosyl)-5-[(5-phosphoribosylamino)methylideneamino]imidazole-4-carboxamide isomerase [Clostridiales bacterium]|nr:1-(5-phosphoribosyl)-5-[(5-phosphoribosylamino)methylideneamino]imidazole-4-carboxamide isomerase [Clostridiales bacterium]